MKLNITGFIRASVIRGGVITNTINKITSSELSQLSGITGNIQTQLNEIKQKISQVQENAAQELTRVQQLYEEAKASYNTTKSALDALRNLVASVTATADKVLSGNTFIGSDGQKKNGSMVNRGAVSQSLPINGSYTIPQGYHNGSGKVTQSITTQGAKTYVPTKKDLTINSGVYLTGNQTIKGEPNLIPDNILEGKSIFGVNGTVPVSKYKTYEYTSGLCNTSILTVNGDFSPDDSPDGSYSRFRINGLSFRGFNIPIKWVNVRAKRENSTGIVRYIDYPTFSLCVIMVTIHLPNNANWYAGCGRESGAAIGSKDQHSTLKIVLTVSEQMGRYSSYGDNIIEVRVNGSYYNFAQYSETASKKFPPCIPVLLDDSEKIYLTSIYCYNDNPVIYTYSDIDYLLQNLVVELQILYSADI